METMEIYMGGANYIHHSGRGRGDPSGDYRWLDVSLLWLVCGTRDGRIADMKW